jgi:glutaredoxin
MPSFAIIYLEGCPYSMEAEKILNELKKTENIKYKITRIQQINKESIKTKGHFSSFPQIYLQTNNQYYTIGGCDQFKEFIDCVNKEKGKNTFINCINQAIN